MKYKLHFPPLENEGPGHQIKPNTRNQVIMRDNIRYRFGMSLLRVSLTLVIGTDVALAQSGSAGGSIGNDEKTLSGSRSEPSSNQAVPALRGRDAEQPRGSDDGAVNNFDGTWAYNGASTNCGGSGSGFWVVSGGQIIGKKGVVVGRISPDGDYRSTAVGKDGVTVTSTGKISGNSGGGSFRRADGCVGRWTAKRAPG
jgi:hypothetical protein